MGVGVMSTPTKPEDAGLDNVSWVLVILEYLFYVLDGRPYRGSQHSNRPINRVG